MGGLRKLAVLGVGALVGRKLLRASRHAVGELFNSHTKHAQEHLIGAPCRVTTSRVTDDFGQASYDDGAGDLILHVRATTPNTLERGAEARIVDYDPRAEVYWIEAA